MPSRYHDTQKRFPHLANCFKYAMAFTVALFGVFTPPNSTTTAVKVTRSVRLVYSRGFNTRGLPRSVLVRVARGRLAEPLEGLVREHLFHREEAFRFVHHQAGAFVVIPWDFGGITPP